MTNIIVVIFAYLCGSIPFSFLIPHYWKGTDIRQVGSGNIGATNVIRALGKPIGILCLVLDSLKTYIPVMLIRYVFMKGSPDMPLWLALAAFAGVIGHDFSVYMKFRGGKGVASTMGVFFAINPVSGLVFLTLGLTLAFMTRIMSVASIAALTVTTICIFFLEDQTAFHLLYIALTLFSILRHRKNVIRLIKGNENKFM